MSELPCILSDKLYVPEQYVRPKHLSEYIYRIEDEDDETDYSVFEGYKEHRTFHKGSMVTVREIRTFSKILDTDTGVTYYGFSRGDLPKAFRLFGDYDWQDVTAAPKFKYPLQFDPTKRLLTFAENGRGQEEAVNDWLAKRYGIIRAAPRFGKTIASIYIATQLGLKTLIIAHQIDLLLQFYKSFMQFSNTEAIRKKLGVEVKYNETRDQYHFPKDARGVVIGFFNEHKNPEKLDVCLLSWQKFASKYGPERLEKYRDTWGLVIVDEVHRASSLKYAGVVNKINARYRLGLTGTVERCDGQEFVTKDIIGPVTAEGRVRQVPCKVVVIPTGVPIHTNINEPLPRIYKKIYNSRKRTDMVVRELEKDYEAGHHICVAFHSGSVVQLLDFTKRLTLEGLKAEAFYGGSKDRAGILKRAINGDVRVQVCNQRMLTGIDIPCWDVFYNMFPSGNVVFNEKGELSGNHYQNFSRIRTPYDYPDGHKKEFGIIKEFLDEGTGFIIGTFKKRLKAYKNQGFPIEYRPKPIKKTNTEM